MTCVHQLKTSCQFFQWIDIEADELPASTSPQHLEDDLVTLSDAVFWPSSALPALSLDKTCAAAVSAPLDSARPWVSHMSSASSMLIGGVFARPGSDTPGLAGYAAAQLLH